MPSEKEENEVNPRVLRWGFIIPNNSIYYFGSQTLILSHSGWNIRCDGGQVSHNSNIFCINGGQTATFLTANIAILSGQTKETPTFSSCLSSYSLYYSAFAFGEVAHARHSENEFSLCSRLIARLLAAKLLTLGIVKVNFPSALA